MTEAEPVEPGSPPETRSWRLPLTNWQIILIALVVVGGRLVIDFSQRIIEGQQKVNEQRQLEAEIEDLLQEQQDLIAAKAYYSSPTYIEVWAHDQGKMVREGEVLVVPIYERPSSLAVATPETRPDEAVVPWRVWWSLFFDGAPPF